MKIIEVVNVDMLNFQLDSTVFKNNTESRKCFKFSQTLKKVQIDKR